MDGCKSATSCVRTRVRLTFGRPIRMPIFYSVNRGEKRQVTVKEARGLFFLLTRCGPEHVEHVMPLDGWMVGWMDLYST